MVVKWAATSPKHILYESHINLLISIADITGVHPESSTSFVYLFLAAIHPHTGVSRTKVPMMAGASHLRSSGDTCNKGEMKAENES